MDNDTHIVPVLIGDAKRAKEISDILLNDYDIYCQAIQVMVFFFIIREHKEIL